MHNSTKLLALVAPLAIVSLAVTLQSFAESGGGQQSPSAPTNQSQPETRGIGPQPKPSPSQQDFSKNTWEIPKDADATKNPVEATEESIAKGKELFMGKPLANCVFCHGETGEGNKENLAKLRRTPADLSDITRMPKLSDGEIFWKITKGIPGIMPGRGDQLTEEQRWHLVNFVRTLAKEKPKA
jgi:mono/diheme cytochrome c family protein